MATSKAKAMTKGKLMTHIAEETGLPLKDIRGVYDVLSKAIVKQVRTTGVFVLPGLVKFMKVRKPAVKGGQVKPNPFKPGETMITKPRPAHNVVRARPLKGIKEAVQ